MSKEEEAKAPSVDTDGNNTTPSSSLWNLLSPTNYVPTNLSSMLQQSNIDISSVLSSGGNGPSSDKSKELCGGNGSNSLDDNDSIQYEGDSAASLQKQSSIDRNKSVNTTNINSNNLDIITESNYDELISPTSNGSYSTNTSVSEGGTSGGSLSYTDTDTRTYDDGLSHDDLTNDGLSNDELTDNDELSHDELTDLEDIGIEESLSSLANIVPLPQPDNIAASQHSNQTQLTKEYQHRSKSKLFLLVTVLTVLVCGGVALSLGVSLSDLGFGSGDADNSSEGESSEGGDVVIDYLPVEPTTTIEEEEEVVEEVDCDEFGFPIVVDEEVIESSEVADVEQNEVSPNESVEEQTAVSIEQQPEPEPEEAQELPDNITCEQINQVMSHQMVTLDTITAYHKDGTLPEGITEEIMGPVLEVQAPGVTMESLREVSPEMVVKCQQGGVRRRKLRVGGGTKSRVSRRNLLRGGRPAHHNKVNRHRRTFKCKPKELNIGGFTGDSSISEGGGIGGFTGTSEGTGGIGGFTGGVGGFTGTSESTAAPSPQPTTLEPTPLPSPPPSLAPVTSKPTNEPTVNTPSPSKAPITMEPSEEPTTSPSFSPSTKPTLSPTTLEPTSNPTTAPVPCGDKVCNHGTVCVYLPILATESKYTCLKQTGEEQEIEIQEEKEEEDVTGWVGIEEEVVQNEAEVEQIVEEVSTAEPLPTIEELSTAEPLPSVEEELPDGITCDQIVQVVSNPFVSIEMIRNFHEDGTLPSWASKELVESQLPPGLTLEDLRKVSPEMVEECQELN